MTQNTLSRRRQTANATDFDELYTRYAQTIYRLGWAMLQNAQSAEDVVQETFLRAYKARRRFDPRRAGIGTWLYQIALNYCRSRLRRRQLLSFVWINQIAPAAHLSDPAPGPEARLLRAEHQNALWQAVQKLSPRLKEVVMLYYYLELPAVQIAAIINCPEGTIYSRLYHARRRLAYLLVQEGITPSDLFEAQNAS